MPTSETEGTCSSLAQQDCTRLTKKISVMEEFHVELVLPRGPPVFRQLGSRNLTNASVNRFVRG